MRPGALLAFLVLALAGCAQIQAILTPSRRALPASSVPAPPPAQPPSPGAPGPGAPSAPLTQEIAPDRERRLREDTQKKLDEVERALRQIEGRPLKPKERETFLLAHSFLDQGRKALAAQEYERAANLAAKARTLTDDLPAATK